MVTTKVVDFESTMKARFICAALCFAMLAAVAAGSEVALTLKATPVHSRIGETIAFDFVYQNTSNHAIKVLPDPQTYYARMLSLRREDNGAAAETLQFAETSMYYAGLVKHVVTVPPGGCTTWTLRGDVLTELPTDWSNKKPGLYIVFPGVTAFKLPGPGRYRVEARYELTREHPIWEFVSGRPKLWSGTVRSQPVTLEIAP